MHVLGATGSGKSTLLLNLITQDIEHGEGLAVLDPHGDLIDDILEVEFRLAYQRALDLCQNEGLLAGPSSGLIFEGALEIIMRDNKGFGVMIFPDSIFKYTSNMMKHIPGLAAGTTV